MYKGRPHWEGSWADFEGVVLAIQFSGGKNKCKGHKAEMCLAYWGNTKDVHVAVVLMVTASIARGEVGE